MASIFLFLPRELCRSAAEFVKGELNIIGNRLSDKAMPKMMITQTPSEGVLGVYDPKKNLIVLYAETIRRRATSTTPMGLLSITLAHEVTHWAEFKMTGKNRGHYSSKDYAALHTERLASKGEIELFAQAYEAVEKMVSYNFELRRMLWELNYFDDYGFVEE